jgi:hypothetical protein
MNFKKDDLGDKIYESKADSLKTLFPYSDGNYLFYPAWRFGRGFILSKEQTEILLSRNKWGLGLFAMISIVGVLGSFGRQFSDAFPHIVDTLWFWSLFILAGCLYQYLVWMIRTWNLRRMFPHALSCSHSFPAPYFRDRNFIKHHMPGWIHYLMSGFLSLFILALLTFSTLDFFVERSDENYQSLLQSPYLWVLCISVPPFAVLFFRRARRQAQFQKVYGRKPNASDLKPIDPVTGRSPTLI